MAYRRRRYHPGPALVPPLEPVGSSRATPQASAVVSPRYIPKEGEDSLQQQRLPIDFDLCNIIPAPASGSTAILIGGPTQSVTRGVAGMQTNIGKVPTWYRGIVDGIFPYAESSGGIANGPRLTSDATVRWSILVDGAAAGGIYGTINNLILTPWNGNADHPLFEIHTNGQLSASVFLNDPNGIYRYLGIRIKGRWIPIKM